MSNSIRKEEKFDRIILRSCMVMLYVLSLRGNESLMLNLTTLCQELVKSRNYYIIPLKGRIKRETVECDHMLPHCLRTQSIEGLQFNPKI